VMASQEEQIDPHLRIGGCDVNEHFSADVI
jgi:hypothetical protein